MPSVLVHLIFFNKVAEGGENPYKCSGPYWYQLIYIVFHVFCSFIGFLQTEKCALRTGHFFIYLHNLEDTVQTIWSFAWPLCFFTAYIYMFPKIPLICWICEIDFSFLGDFFRDILMQLTHIYNYVLKSIKYNGASSHIYNQQSLLPKPSKHSNNYWL